MPGLFGGLPPGLHGYRAAVEDVNRDAMNELGMAGGIIGLQNALQEQQLMPLKIAQLQLALSKAAQQQAALRAVTGGAPAESALAQGAMQGDIGPTNTNAARIPANMDAAHLALLAADVNPKTITAIRDIQAPKMEVNRGYAYNPRQVGTGFLPGIDISQTGQAVGVTPSPGGGLPSIQPLPGSLGAYGQFQNVEQREKARFDPFLGQLDPQNRPIPQTRLQFAEGMGAGGPPQPGALGLAGGRSPGVGMGMSPSQVSANTEAGKEFIAEMRANYAKLRDTAPFLENVDKAKALAAGQAQQFMGPLGESKLAITKFLRANVPGMGSLDTAGVTSVEELRTRLFQQVMDNLKKMDAQPSTYQQQVMEKAFGTLGTDPQSIPQILDVFADIMRGRVAIHNQTVDSAESRGTSFPHDIRIKTNAGGIRRYNPATGRIE